MSADIARRPGALRTRATLEARTEVPDGAGGTDPVWATEAEVWINVAPVKAASALPAEGRRQDVTHTVTLRHRDGISIRKRFRVGTRIFEIRAVHDPDERGVFLECQCEEQS